LVADSEGRARPGGGKSREDNLLVGREKGISARVGFGRGEGRVDLPVRVEIRKNKRTVVAPYTLHYF
jgi:hypothetical protein